jgi:hypothetical protein
MACTELGSATAAESQQGHEKSYLSERHGVVLRLGENPQNQTTALLYCVSVAAPGASAHAYPPGAPKASKVNSV